MAKVHIAYEGFSSTPFREEVVVSEASWNLDNPSENSITIQNYKTQFEDLFSRTAAAVQQLEYNKTAYARAASILDSSGLINTTLLANSLGAIPFGVGLSGDNSVYTTNDGLFIVDPNNTSNMMRLTWAGLGITQDQGDHWNTAIGFDGINAELINAGTLNTKLIQVFNEDKPAFKWDKNGLSAFSSLDSGEYDYSTYVRFDQYGIYGVANDETYVASSMDDIKDKARFGLLWDGFFIKSDDVGGYVSISSGNDFQVMTTDGGVEQERIKIGRIGETEEGNQYGIRIRNASGDSVFETNDNGDIIITGEINATGGRFTKQVTVGSDLNGIVLDGESTPSKICSTSYLDNPMTGWAINGEGDAVFNNITARGAIKTAVFEYQEIQAVGGAFLFRPSSTIREAAPVYGDAPSPDEDPILTNDLKITVENAALFKPGEWCKVSNYTGDGDVSLDNTGLSHIYKIIQVRGNEVVLENGMNLFTENNEEENPNTDSDQVVVEELQMDDLIGGALISFGVAQYEVQDMTGISDPQAAGLYEKVNGAFELTEDTTPIVDKTYYYAQPMYNNGVYNYGIGVNSSDDYIALPERSISLFESNIHSDETTKVSYNFKAILGTFPPVGYLDADSDYYQYLQGKQGIFTDTFYFGNDQQFITYYADNQNDRHLVIQAADVKVQGPSGNYFSIAEIVEDDDELRHAVEVDTAEPSLTLRSFTYDQSGQVEYTTNAIKLTDDEIDFIANNDFTNPIVSIDTSEIKIPQANITTLKMRSTTGNGRAFWIMRDNGHLSLKISSSN